MNLSPETDPYADPSVYDLINTPGTAAELNGLERIAARFVGSSSGRRPDPRRLRWLEPCCGTGRYLRLLARRRVKCLGVELSPEVAAYASERLARAGQSEHCRVVVGDIRHLDRLSPPRGFAGPFDFAFNPHNSIRHLLTPTDLVRHLKSVRSVLSPRGVYAVGVGLQPADAEIFGEDVHAASRGAGPGRVRVTSVFQYFESPVAGPHRLERVVCITTVRRGERAAPGRQQQTTSSYDLLCLEPGLWAGCLRRAGMMEVGIVDDDRVTDLPAGRTDYAYRILKPVPR